MLRFFRLFTILFSHLFNYRVMKYSVTQLETRTSSCSSSLEHEKHQLGYMAMEYLADLRFFLKGHPKLETCEQQLSDASNYLLMTLKGIPRLSQIWEKWLDLDSNVIDALVFFLSFLENHLSFN